MTSSFPRDVHEARADIGARLRSARNAGGLTGKQLAQQLGWPPSKVSKIELGRQQPTAADVRAWCGACNTPEREALEISARLEEASARYAAWRSQLARGVHLRQTSLLEMDARTSVWRNLELTMIPGLLQTADYARVLFEEAVRLSGAPGAVEDAVALRLRRQDVLYQRGKRFHFLVWEAALHVGRAPGPVMAAQLDRLVAATSVPQIRLGIIPQHARLPLGLKNSFVIRDATSVLVETYEGELRLTTDDEVALYRSVFDVLSPVARYDAEARTMLVHAIETWT